VGKEGEFVAVGSHIFISQNGKDWSQSCFPDDFMGRLNSVVWSGEYFVAVGNDNGQSIMMVSRDGLHLHLQWEEIETKTRNPLHNISWNGNYFLVGGSGGAIFRLSH